MTASVDPLPWLTRLDEAREVALGGVDPEGVHQVRVASRRLRVWLTLAGHRALHDDLRWLCRALGPARDLDVLGPVLTPPARDRLHARALGATRAALGSHRWAGLRAAFASLPAARAEPAAAALHDLEARLGRRRRELEVAPGREEVFVALHRLRRAVRAARYGREWLGLDAAVLAAEQEALGAACDLLAARRFCEAHRAPVPAALEVALDAALTQLAAAP